jgi:NAD(P)H dehydrogenase (quinone)
MHAPPKPANVPVITPEILEQYDAFMFGVPTRYGNFPAQWKVCESFSFLSQLGWLSRLQTFWDSTGQLWAKGALSGKYAGMFVSTASPGGGQESTFLAALSTYSHHGMVFVPLGYAHTFPLLTNLSEVHGGKKKKTPGESAFLNHCLSLLVGSPWGAGTYAGTDGSRQPTALELEIATIQGKEFAKVVSKVK